MLILTREPGETVVVGEGKEEVHITVMAAHSGRAKLAINAPLHISVDRLEIRKKKEAEQKSWIERLKDKIGV